MTVIAASRNLAEQLTASVDETIGRGLGSILGLDFAEAVRRRHGNGKLRGEAPWQSTLKLDERSPGLDVAVHAHAGLILVELQRAGADDERDALTAVRRLQDIVVDLRAARNDLAELARVTVRGVRALTGYERVLVYRFDADWNGEALAEDKPGDWDQSLQGLHFPASDIPSQARELYRRSPTRWVLDRDAVPVPLDVDPAWNPFRTSQAPADQPPSRAIDLSFARLRSMSPIHMQYHRNLGVNGSMSLSIMHEGRLWGLVVCHHRAPYCPSPGQRAAAAALTDAFALRVGLAERTATEQARSGDLARLSALLAHMAQAEMVTPALTDGDVNIGGLFEATGAVVIYDNAVSLLGATPPEPDVRRLAAWLRTQGRPRASAGSHLGPTPGPTPGSTGPIEAGGAMLFQTDNLTAAYQPWKQHTAVASGLLAVFLSADRSDMLLWFRPEEPRFVNWGGNVRKGADQNAAYLPRLSFERWVEMRHGVAKPWAEWELEIAESLRHGITEVVVRSLRRIADLNDRLRQSQKMEAVGQLTGGIAHDFNNLLTGVTGSLELMRTRTAQGRYGDLDRYIGTAMTAANRGASLIQRLLAFSRRQTLDPKAVDVNRLTASMEDLIRRTVGPAIQVETMVSGGLWTALCDANQLENALLNLAINARDAMPSGGRLSIVASNATLDQAYARRHDVAPGQYVAISVADTGTGMAPDVAARVFEPFFTTKPFGQGTGLGLSMVYGFVKQSNGYTRISSEVGRGTTVRLYLPRTPGNGEADADIPGLPPPSGAKPGETVLVVDDEAVVRMLIGDVLRDLDYGVIEAADGAEALLVLQSKPPIDLLVSDVGLPGGMNGRQLADAARVRQPQLKVLFITGHAESTLLGNGVLDPDMQVLAKPFALDALAAKVRTMM